MASQNKYVLWLLATRSCALLLPVCKEFIAHKIQQPQVSLFAIKRSLTKQAPPRCLDAKARLAYFLHRIL